MTSPETCPPARSPAEVLALMSSRHHVAPKRLVAPGPTDEDLQLIFAAAASAPDHGRIQPWRFVQVPDDKRQVLGEAFVAALLRRDPQATPEQIEAAHDKALRAPCLMLAVTSEAVSEPPIPFHERLVSLGCAIQNMLLMAQALGLGCGLTSGQALDDPALRSLFRLSDTERAICFLNFGTIQSVKPARPRAAYTAFTSSL